MNSYDFMKFQAKTIHHSICLNRSPFWSDKPKKYQAYNVYYKIKLQLHNDSHLYFNLSGYNLIIKSKHK